MKRWPTLTIWATLGLVMGCSPSVQVGLANAPRLGGTGWADDPVRDVVANGSDACGRHAERGPLRGHVPPCPTLVHPVVTASLPAAKAADGLVLPWLKHFYVGWPCPRAMNAADRNSAAWASIAPAPATCVVP